MHRDKNRNDFVATLAERQAEMIALPNSDGAAIITMHNKLYQFIDTADGSPSVRMASIEQRPEAMHHSGGALTESLYIYGEALKSALEENFTPSVLSVGLGCAYNEWIALAYFLNRGTPTHEIYLESFENDELIRSEFLRFLDSKLKAPNNFETSAHFQQIFENVMTVVANSLQVEPTHLLGLGRKLFADKRWLIRETLDLKTDFTHPFSVVFFDAFSSKATPGLWNEEFLNQFLLRAPGKPCVFATYASTATLKKALKTAGFELKDQLGFGGKRESTRAYRYGTVVTI